MNEPVIRFRCPACHSVNAVEGACAGLRVHCFRCGKAGRLGRAAAPVPPPPPPPAAKKEPPFWVLAILIPPALVVLLLCTCAAARCFREAQDEQLKFHENGPRLEWRQR